MVLGVFACLGTIDSSSELRNRSFFNEKPMKINETPIAGNNGDPIGLERVGQLRAHPFYFSWLRVDL